MGKTMTYKILEDHLVSGTLTPGEEISIKIDYTLTQDSTGTMAYLQFEALGVPRVKTKRSVAYIDHNTLQSGPENADDHRYIRTVAKNTGFIFPAGQRYMPPGQSGEVRGCRAQRFSDRTAIRPRAAASA